jgi:hypothetical protein
MNLTFVHYTARPRFALDPAHIPGGADEPGLFLYPAGAEGDGIQAWPGRRRVVVSVPADAAVFVQSFEPGEFSRAGIEEWFLPAGEFARVTLDRRGPRPARGRAPGVAMTTTAPIRTKVRTFKAKRRGQPAVLTYAASLQLDGAWSRDYATDSHPTPAAALADLAARLTADADGWERRYLGCHDGTVVRVGRSHGHWGYEIAGPGRQHISGLIDNQTATFASVLAAARRHTDAYGGLVWEC